jgi:hypothetical protein
VRIQGLAAVGLLVGALLSGCIAAEPYAFLREEISSDDVLPDDILDQVPIDADTVRFQGEYDGVDVFLALSNDEPAGQGVQLVLIGDGPDEWVAASSGWDSKINVGGLVGVEAAYWPEGLDEPTDGWTALSDWVEVRG